MLHSQEHSNCNSDDVTLNPERSSKNFPGNNNKSRLFRNSNHTCSLASATSRARNITRVTNDSDSVDDDDDLSIDIENAVAAEPDVISNQEIVHSLPNFETKLLDFDLADMQHLLWIIPTLEFIPEACVKKVRDCYILVLKKLKEQPENIVNWKKLFLLPLILLTFNFVKKEEKSGMSKLRKNLINKRAELILKDEWESFTFGSLPLKRISSEPPSQRKQEESRNARGEKLAKNQEFSRAMSTITSKAGLCPASIETVNGLRQLHPQRCEYTIEPEKLDEMKTLKLNSSSREVYQLTGPRMRGIVSKKPNLVTPGIDGFRFDHLRALMGSGKPEIPSEDEFAELFTDIIVMLMDVEGVPLGAYEFLRLNNLIAIEKPDKTIRPIGMGSIFRKLCCGIFLAYTFQGHPMFQGESFNKMHFSNLQYGVDSMGSEKIIHYFDLFMEANPESDVFFADGSNAFNSTSRLKGIEEAHTYFPQMTPFLMKIYYENNYGCYFGLKEGVQKIPSVEGLVQGCILGSWLWCMSNHSFLKGLSNILVTDSIQTSGTIKSFIDDTNLGGKTPKMFEALRYMFTEGPKIGFTLNKKKGAYLLGKCSTDLEAVQKKTQLIEEFGLEPDVIRIHPDNLATSIGPSLYGSKVLGAYVGDPIYIRNQLVKKENELRDAKDAIMRLSHKQIQYLLLKWCYDSKMTFLQRVMAPRKLVSLIEKFQDFKKEILDHIIGSTIGDKEFQLALLPLSESGLGLTNSPLISFSAFVASSLECYRDSSDFEKEITNRLNPNDSTCYTDISTSVQKISEFDEQMNLQSINILAEQGKPKLQQHLSNCFLHKSRREVLDQFDGLGQVFLNSLRNDESGLHLNTAPKTDMHAFNNREFTSVLCFRLYMKQPHLLSTPFPCPCTTNRHWRIDPKGFHSATGCGLGGNRIATHNEVNRAVQRICRYAGLYTRIEPTGVFQGNTFNLGEHSRGDLAICNLGPRSILSDVRVTSVVPANGAHLSAIEMRNPELVNINLSRNYKSKMDKYGAAAKEANYEFLPMVVDIGGKLHPEFKKFLVDVLKLASESRNIRFSVLWNYWISALMVTLQKGRARSIIRLGTQVFGRQVRETFETSDQVVSRGSYRN